MLKISQKMGGLPADLQPVLRKIEDSCKPLLKFLESLPHSSHVPLP